MARSRGVTVGRFWITWQDQETQGMLLTAYPEGDSCRKDLFLTDPVSPEPIFLILPLFLGTDSLVILSILTKQAGLGAGNINDSGDGIGREIETVRRCSEGLLCHFLFERGVLPGFSVPTGTLPSLSPELMALFSLSFL